MTGCMGCYGDECDECVDSESDVGECPICGVEFTGASYDHDGCVEHCHCDECRAESYTGPRDCYDDGDEFGGM